MHFKAERGRVTCALCLPTTEQAAPSESPPPSRRQSPSSWTSALREALPSATRRSTSLQPQGSPNWQWAGRSAHEGFGGWQEYQGDYHRLVPDWHGALSCASLAAPFDTCSPPAEREQILGVTGFWLQRRDPPLELDRKAVPCGLPIADQLRARRDRPRSTPRCGGHFRHP